MLPSFLTECVCLFQNNAYIQLNNSNGSTSSDSAHIRSVASISILPVYKQNHRWKVTDLFHSQRDDLFLLFVQKSIRIKNGQVLLLVHKSQFPLNLFTRSFTDFGAPSSTLIAEVIGVEIGGFFGIIFGIIGLVSFITSGAGGGGGEGERAKADTAVSGGEEDIGGDGGGGGGGGGGAGGVAVTGVRTSSSKLS